MNPISFKFDNERITNHGGFELINCFVDIGLNLFSLLEKNIHLIRRKAKYSIADLTYMLINLNILFPFRIAQLDYLKNDDFLKEKFGINDNPESDTFRRHILKFSRKNLTWTSQNQKGIRSQDRPGLTR